MESERIRLISPVLNMFFAGPYPTILYKSAGESIDDQLSYTH
jgi:hypothetical protein